MISVFSQKISCVVFQPGKLAECDSRTSSKRSRTFLQCGWIGWKGLCYAAPIGGNDTNLLVWAACDPWPSEGSDQTGGVEPLQLHVQHVGGALRVSARCESTDPTSKLFFSFVVLLPADKWGCLLALKHKTESRLHFSTSVSFSSRTPYWPIYKYVCRHSGLTLPSPSYINKQGDVRG